MIEPTTKPLNNDTSHGQCVQWTEWFGHLAGKPNLNFLEIGSYEGQSAIWFLRNIIVHPTSKLICVDTWHAGVDMPLVEDDSLLTTFLDNIMPWKDRCGIMRGRSEDVLPTLPLMRFDLAYIDGSHAAPDVLSDSVLTWRLVKPGGLLIWDDYAWEGHEDPHRTPKLAVDAFLSVYEGMYEMVAREYQVCIRKLRV